MGVILWRGFSLASNSNLTGLDLICLKDTGRSVPCCLTQRSIESIGFSITYEYFKCVHVLVFRLGSMSLIIVGVCLYSSSLTFFFKDLLFNSFHFLIPSGFVL